MAIGANESNEQLRAEVNRLETETRELRARLALSGDRAARAGNPSPAGAPPRPASPLDRHDLTFRDWIAEQIAAEPYWFHRIELAGDLVTPGWSDPKVDKLPYYGLPPTLAGQRVLDIGCAEGFFSFEAERRGAREVVAIDSFGDSVRRFGICRAALGSRIAVHLANVYELSEATFGTFDVVMFYGVFYHLKHPWRALAAIRDVAAGTLLFQTLVDDESPPEAPSAMRFHPRGIMSGPNKEHWDPTVFWVPNRRACIDILDAVGFVDIEVVNHSPFVLRARNPRPFAGMAPDHTLAPWS